MTFKDDYLEIPDEDFTSTQYLNFYKEHLKLCSDIAKDAHDGQRRKCGEDYINHPLRVANMLDNYFHKCVALLHDVVEDTDVGLSELISKKVDSRVVSGVMILTHFKHQPYDEYIQNICKTKWLINVKFADIIDNLCGQPTEKQKIKYAEAVKMLLNALE